MSNSDVGKSEVDWSQLEGRSVLINGGASGLGEATTIKFADHGAWITIADKDEELGKALAEKLRSHGKHVQFVYCDATDWTSSAAAFKAAVNFSPSKTLDAAILYAGISAPNKSIVDMICEQSAPSREEDVAFQPVPESLNVNLNGLYMSSWLALHYFRVPPVTGEADRKKSLVLVSSLAGYLDASYNTAYCTSKFGVRGFFRSIRSETHKVNARVNNIAPGYFLTPLTMRNHGIHSPEEPSKIIGTRLPWGDLNHVVEIAGRCTVDDTLHGEFAKP
jgi:5'-hydroxyaverantin dehydrogenase